jgi:hypothetical protein
MVKTNMAAWTPAENNPPYISINYVDSNGTVEIIIRERSKKTGETGEVVSVVLTQEEFSQLISDAIGSAMKL